MENQKSERNSFTGSIGFVLAAAGSAVGLGNIWRFPYFVAKDGGGLFLVVYLALVLTFGFTLLVTEIAIGRKTKESPLTAYKKLNSKWGFLGIFSFVIPFIVYPYYCAIGGWVLKYLITYISGHASSAIQDGYFGAFISGKWQPILFMTIFSAATFAIVYMGVEKGIEKSSKILMPILAVIILFISIYALFLKFTDDNGVTRTGLQGFGYYVIPRIKGVTLKQFLTVCLDATGQLFYSLSIAMGIMVAYGSYMKNDVNLAKSADQIAFFDTVIAFLAGMMIIPSVYVFAGEDGMSAGPGLIFVSLPKIFNSLGFFGNIIGVIFFMMVLFAALTSAVSILEAIVSSMIDKKGWSRRHSTVVMAGLTFIVAVIVCLGYNLFYFEFKLPNGSVGQILDLMDYTSNNVLMPITSFLTCIFIGWVCKPKTALDEISLNGEKFYRRGLYVVMLKYIAPVLLFIIMLMSFGVFG